MRLRGLDIQPGCRHMRLIRSIGNQSEACYYICDFGSAKLTSFGVYADRRFVLSGVRRRYAILGMESRRNRAEGRTDRMLSSNDTTQEIVVSKTFVFKRCTCLKES